MCPMQSVCINAKDYKTNWMMTKPKSDMDPMIAFHFEEEEDNRLQ